MKDAEQAQSQKDAAGVLARVEALLRMNRRERRRAGVTGTRDELEAIRDRAKQLAGSLADESA